MRNPININKSLFKRGDRVLCALSGGADSVCLTHALASLRRELGIEVMAAHYSHGIRPEAADFECSLARELCRSLDVPFFTEQGDVPAYCAANGLGLEEGARRLRYDFLRRVGEEQGCNLIATAHNLGDNSETVILNLTRGSGLGGLRGIPEVNGDIVRPLLGVSRREIERYNDEYKLKYATDNSNFDDKYSRNRIRLAVLPQLKKINPALDETLSGLAERAREADDFMRISALELLKTKRRAGECPLDIVRGAHPALRYYLYSCLAEEAGAPPLALSAAHVEAISRLAAEGKVSSRLDLGGGLLCAVTYDGLSFSAGSDLPVGETKDGETALETGKTLLWNGYKITLGGSGGVAFVEEEIEPPVIVRSRREGDRVSMSYGSKSVKKLLIEKKIPAARRDFIPVICDKKGVLMVGNLAKDGQRCYKDKGVPLKIECGRMLGDEE